MSDDDKAHSADAFKQLGLNWIADVFGGKSWHIILGITGLIVGLALGRIGYHCGELFN